MDPNLMIVITFIAILAIFAAMSMYVIGRQQQTIEQLTNRLMARDYGEYKRHETPVSVPETKQRKPMSYHDDPSIPLDDEEIDVRG